MKKDLNKSKTANKYRAIIITFILDVVFAVGAYFAARNIMFFAISSDVPSNFKLFEFPIMAMLIVLTLSMMVFFDCYNSVWKYAGRVEFFKFLMAYFSSFIAIMILKLVLTKTFQIELWTPLVLQYLLFSGILSGITRFFYGIVHYAKHVRNMVDTKSSRNMRRTIVIGAGYTGSLVINRFINNPHEGYLPVALIDDDTQKQGMKIYGVKVEGGFDSLDDIVENFGAQAIVIAIMSLTKSRLKEIYSKCAGYNIPIKIMPAMENADVVSSRSLSLRDIRIEELLGRDEFKVRQELIDCSVKDKIVCVTGGAGSIGSELCRQALNFGCKHLIIFDQHENGMFELNQEFSKKYDTSKYTLVMGTVREKSKVREVFELYSPEVVFHAAAYKHVPMMEISATEAIKNNVFGTLNVIETSMETGVKKFVLVSTDKAVNPANIMGASKRIAEMLIQTRGSVSKMQMAAVRFGNVLGSSGSVIPIFLKQIKKGEPITLTDRNIKRYFMTIPEAVSLVLQTGALASSGEVFVLDMGEPVFIYDLACDLIRINGLVPEKDVPIKVTGLRPGEKLFEELRYDKEDVDNTQHEGIFVTKMQKLKLEAFNNDLEELRSYAFKEDVEMTERKIFEIVPSVYRDIALKDRQQSLLDAEREDDLDKTPREAV